MGRFNDNLIKAKEAGINMCDLTIANEAEAVLGNKDVEEFEAFCQMVKDTYLEVDDYYDVNAICHCVKDMFEDGEYESYQEMIGEVSTREIAEKASYYL